MTDFDPTSPRPEAQLRSLATVGEFLEILRQKFADDVERLIGGPDEAEALKREREFPTVERFVLHAVGAFYPENVREIVRLIGHAERALMSARDSLTVAADVLPSAADDIGKDCAAHAEDCTEALHFLERAMGRLPTALPDQARPVGDVVARIGQERPLTERERVFVASMLDYVGYSDRPHLNPETGDEEAALSVAEFNAIRDRFAPAAHPNVVRMRTASEALEDAYQAWQQRGFRLHRLPGLGISAVFGEIMPVVDQSALAAFFGSPPCATHSPKPRYWQDDAGRLNCRHGILVFGDSCVDCERDEA